MEVACALLLSAVLLAPQGGVDDGSRVLLVERSDPIYDGLSLPSAVSTDRVWGSRLVVLRNGSPVLDHGLRNDLLLVSGSENGGTQGIVEEARTSSDEKTAVLLRSRFLLPETEGDEEPEDVVRFDSTLTWIDPDHPGGRWTVEIEPGRWVQEMVVLPRSRGVAVATSLEAHGEATLHIYGPTGEPLFDVGDLRASVLQMVPAAHGGFFAVDLAYVTSSPGRDRAILVIDMLKESRWLYSWSYGGEMEPVSWALLETGVLTLDTPGGFRRYDRNGLLLDVDRKRKRKR